MDASRFGRCQESRATVIDPCIAVMIVSLSDDGENELIEPSRNVNRGDPLATIQESLIYGRRSKHCLLSSPDNKPPQLSQILSCLCAN